MVSPPIKLEDLEREARKLSHADRARLIESLLATLEEDREIEEAWREEIRRRTAEIDAGEADLIPADQVLAELDTILKE